MKKAKISQTFCGTVKRNGSQKEAEMFCELEIFANHLIAAALTVFYDEVANFCMKVCMFLMGKG